MQRLRLPLQPGTSCLNALAASAGAFGVAFALGPICYVLAREMGVGGKEAVVAISMLAWVAVGVLFVVGVRQFRAARRRRPSDVVISAEGVEIDGGAHEGFVMGWRDLGIDDWRVEQDGGTTRLWGSRGDDFALGEATTDGERASFERLVRTLQACAHHSEGTAEPAAASLFRCTACGSALAPEDAERVSCEHCGTAVIVPAAVRERARGSALATAQRAQSRRALTALLAQPDAATVSQRISALALAMFVPWLLVSMFWFGGFGLTRWEGFESFVFAWFAALAAWLFAHALISGRYAITLVSSLAAVTPSRVGQRPRCRACGGPLGGNTADIIVVCGYCDAENLVALDVPHVLRTEGAQEHALREAIAIRDRARLTQIVATVLAVVSVVIAVRMFNTVL